MQRILPLLSVAIGCGSGANGGRAPDAASIDADPPVANCEPPDVLVVLDRTASMAERPDGTFPPNSPAGHAETKWSIALAAVEALSSELEMTIRFGIALFPRAPAGTACVTLSERLAGTKATNPQCEAGEVLVSPNIATANAIGLTLDPEQTRLCTSTPIGAGLATARMQLAATRGPSRSQYVLFVGDGADTCNAELALSNTDALARDGVKTYVVAFDNGAPAGVDAGLLNDMACAGGTSAGFPNGCTADAAGNYRATNRTGTRLFMTATDSAALATAFRDVAGSVCCGCVL